MKMKTLCLMTAALVLAVAVGCKAQEEIVNVPTPKPQTQTVVVKQEKEEQEHYIEVVGDGEIIAVPDFATIVLGVSVRADTAENASKACQEEVLRAIFAALEQGISHDEILQRGTEIEPAINENREGIANYTATDVLTVSIDRVDMADQILAALMDAGTYEFKSLTYSLTESSEAYRNALAKAMEDALSKATVLAEASGVRIGRVVGITETAYDDRALTGERSERSAIAVSARITVRYEIG